MKEIYCLVNRRRKKKKSKEVLELLPKPSAALLCGIILKVVEICITYTYAQECKSIRPGLCADGLTGRLILRKYEEKIESRDATPEIR